MTLRHKMAGAVCLLLFACGSSEADVDERAAEFGLSSTYNEDRTHVDVTVMSVSHIAEPRTVRCTCGGGTLSSDDRCSMVIGDKNGIGLQYINLESATVNGHIVIAWKKCDSRFKNFNVMLTLAEL
ncbi:MAG TPA: hypothetical protein VFN67_35530 [Polyangiales bacterium]|nr:hypothetical protein [Polyangiales bacterium]